MVHLVYSGLLWSNSFQFGLFGLFRSTSLYSIRFTSVHPVHFGSFWSIVVYLVHFGLLPVNSFHFGLFGPFLSIRSTFVYFGSVQFNLVHLVYFSPFLFIWFSLVHFGLFGLLWWCFMRKGLCRKRSCSLTIISHFQRNFGIIY